MFPDPASALAFALTPYGKLSWAKWSSTEIITLRATNDFTICPKLGSWPTVTTKTTKVENVEKICIEQIIILMNLPLACVLLPFCLFKKVSIFIAFASSPCKEYYKSKPASTRKQVSFI